jgi:deoxyadenosine/deoxycytidine kinase
MSSQAPADDLERHWDSVLQKKGVAGGAVLSICGPSGSGKSTLARSILSTHPTYVEDADENPHLQVFLEGSRGFHAMDNQRWFLQRMADFIQKADNQRPLILDQDPGAIVLAYSRMFREDSMITDAQYAKLLEHLIQVEELLQRWKSPRVVFFLDAPSEVLHRRVLQRSGELRTPPRAWFAKVRRCFCDLWSRFPNAVTLSTVDLTPEEVLDRARRLIEGQSAVVR